MTVALYPGSFDPITNGHLDVIERAAGLFDRLPNAGHPLLEIEHRRLARVDQHAVSDFESELQMAHTNRKLAPDVDTIFLMTALEHAYLSSSLVKEIAAMGRGRARVVPPRGRDVYNS
jgi:pantetheine-phosphate adenylyltransferase